MAGLIEVIDAGFGNSIQDAGRFGFRHMGITVSGALDPMLARCANALAGNVPELSEFPILPGPACIEMRARGPRLVVRDGPVRIALAGDLAATLRRGNGTVLPLLPWTSVCLSPNDVLEVSTVRSGAAYLAVSGGIDTPLQLGSRSLYQRAMIGGLDGQPLARGNLLLCAAVESKPQQEHQADPWFAGEGPLRVMLGPQEGHFKRDSVNLFLDSEYRVTPQMDRMGVRVEGPALVHATPEAADIVSDGVTPGTIQVPGNGQPIILLADCQTVGGYPKIATVISADLPRLAHLQPGQGIRFRAVDAAAARQARLDREAQWRRWLGGIDGGLPNPAALEAMASGCWEGWGSRESDDTD